MCGSTVKGFCQISTQPVALGRERSYFYAALVSGAYAVSQMRPCLSKLGGQALDSLRSNYLFGASSGSAQLGNEI